MNPPRKVGVDVLVVGVVTLCLNALFIYVAAEDASWVALGIAFMIAPISNLVVAIVSLLFTPLAKRHFGVSVAEHVAMSIGFPLLGAVTTFFAVLMMDLRGG